MKKFTLFLIILAILVGIAGYYYYQKNIYSKEILKLEILGPTEVELAQEIEYIVKYKNNGNVRLEEAKLIFEYPKYSLVEEEKPLRQEIPLEDIYPGQEKTLSLKARLLGKEGEAKEAKATLSYRPKNLKASYISETTFTTLIKKVPLTFEFDLPSKIESGKEIRFRLNYFSNVDYPLSNLRSMVEYPANFEFISSNPKALEKTEWEIGLLNKAEGGRIEILGKVFGEVSQELIFKAKLGSWQEGEFVLLKEAIKGVEIIKPSLYLRQEINENPEYLASPGEWLHYEIYFKNIGEDELNNLFLIAQLEGDAFDFETLKSDLGDYQPGDNSIIFDWRRVYKLQYLAPTSEGKVDFLIKLKEEWGITKNPVLKNKIFISQIKEEFITKINSKLILIQKGYFEDEVFGNSGPLPPQVGEATTYTIIWQVKNYYNDVKNVKVKATLPPEVQLTGKIFPEKEAEKFAFDSKSREIVWEVGDLKMSEGVAGTPAPNISFQIRFTPSASQRGQTPEIIKEAKISGQDQWTNQGLIFTADSINTSLPDDPTVDDGSVQ